MGIFKRNPTPTQVSHEIVPSDIRSNITARGNAMLGKATQFYKENPKLVSGAALIASALLLNKMRSRRVP